MSEKEEGSSLLFCHVEKERRERKGNGDVKVKLLEIKLTSYLSACMRCPALKIIAGTSSSSGAGDNCVSDVGPLDDFSWKLGNKYHPQYIGDIRKTPEMEIRKASRSQSHLPSNL